MSRDAAVLVLRLVALALFLAVGVRAIRDGDKDRRRAKLLARINGINGINR